MATTVSINSTNYFIPESGESGWSNSLGNYLVAIADNGIFTGGGIKTLTADLDFGTSYGLKSLYYKSRNADVADTGVLRLANDEGVVWRNFDNDDDLTLKVNESDDLVFDDIKLLTQSDLLDEDDFSSNSDKKPASQQSIKAYVDSSIETIDKELKLKEILTPSVPETGYKKIYPKPDGYVYALNDAGIEQRIGQGVGAFNYIANSDAANGIEHVVPQATSGTWNIESTSDLDELPEHSSKPTAFKISGSGLTINDYVEFEAVGTINTADGGYVGRGEVKVKNISNTITGKYKFQAYDKTSSEYIGQYQILTSEKTYIFDVPLTKNHNVVIHLIALTPTPPAISVSGIGLYFEPAKHYSEDVLLATEALYQSACARFWRSGNYSYTSGNPIEFNTEDQTTFNSAVGVSNSNGVLSVSEPGLYNILTCIHAVPEWLNNTLLYIMVNRGSGYVQERVINRCNKNDSKSHLIGNANIKLEPSDFFYIAVGLSNIVQGGDLSQTYLEITRHPDRSSSNIGYATSNLANTSKQALVPIIQESGEGDIEMIANWPSPGSKKYRWTRTSNKIEFWWYVTANGGSAGTGGTNVWFQLPSDVPSPKDHISNDSDTPVQYAIPCMGTSDLTNFLGNIAYKSSGNYFFSANYSTPFSPTYWSGYSTWMVKPND